MSETDRLAEIKARWASVEPFSWVVVGKSTEIAIRAPADIAWLLAEVERLRAVRDVLDRTPIPPQPLQRAQAMSIAGLTLQQQQDPVTVARIDRMVEIVNETLSTRCPGTMTAYFCRSQEDSGE